MTDFRNNHYVPQWYQKRFLPPTAGDRKFFYLDLKPEKVRSGRRSYTRSAMLRWGPARCFQERDLYTTRVGEWGSTAIERYFFGKVDREAPPALDYFAGFAHPSVNGDAFTKLISFMSLQKLRTPKGLAQLADLVQNRDRNVVLTQMQRLRQVYGATWSECVWSVADASESDVKFIVSDQPVTIYNAAAFPGSRYCRGHQDPDVRLSGSHTLFPLSSDKLLVLTNLSWVRNPYGTGLEMRPNPEYFRDTVFSFLQIQIGRRLSSYEVREINFIIKQRAYRYVAAPVREWLYPENDLSTTQWDRLGGGYLLMPDPRSVTFTSGMVMGFENGARDAIDAYGRRPGQPGYQKDVDNEEWRAFQAFRGEFARVFGPKRRGRSFEFDKEIFEDSPEFHAHTVRMESYYKPKHPRSRRCAKDVQAAD